MIPITRKENYLNEIVGWGETAPEKPLTPEEFFFAAILGEAVQTPEPLSRYQIYLAKIAGRNISVPKPLTRLELFLAKACGMDIETPTPITREEIFWSNYTAIVEFEVEGLPPLTYKAIEGTLENYRIYGNTVGGESVGDLVTSGEHAGEYEVDVTVEGKNLFDSEVVQGGLQGGTGAEFDSDNRCRSSYILLDAGTYTISVSSQHIIGLFIYSSNNVYETYISYSNSPITFSLETVKKVRLGFSTFYGNVSITPSDISNIMLNEGSTPLPYEPYHAPVTTPIYLPEPIKMVGSEAEYIDYKEQKMHRIGADDLDVTLPALPTLTGTNVLSVGTAVQPSKVYVKYKGERQ